MSLLIESIKVLDGKFHNLFYHEQRMKHALWGVFGKHEVVDLSSFFKTMEVPQQGLYKCRVTYDSNDRYVEFEPYSPKIVQSLKVVHAIISYDFKFKNRSHLEKLVLMKEECDEILIVKEGWITDSSYANVVFSDGKTWYTPYSFLLPGTMRQSLIDQGLVKERPISIQDLSSFRFFKLINAMLSFEGPALEIDRIVLS